jgi:hypothetical protein
MRLDAFRQVVHRGADERTNDILVALANLTETGWIMTELFGF